MALSPEALAELEKTQPELVAKYRAKMSGANADVEAAQTAQDYGSVANSLGKAVTDYSNADAKDVVLHNNFQHMGKAPTTIAAHQNKYDSSAIDNATSRNLKRATDARGQAESSFMTEEKLTDMGQGRADAALKRGDEQFARDQRAKSNDPKSAESAAAREYIKMVGGEGAASIAGFDNLTEAQAYKIAPGLMHRQDLKDKAAARREEAAQRSADRGAMMVSARGAKEDARIDAGVTKAADKLSTLQDLNNSIGRVEDQLGFSLENYKDGKAKFKDGKTREVDLPGVSMPLVGRISAYDSDARVLNGAVTEIFNKTLKDRSGAAVSNGEMERLKTEFAAGKYNTEAEMIKALQSYKAAANQAMKNAEAGFAPEILDTYEKRGGQTSRNKPAPMIKSAADAEVTSDPRIDAFMKKNNIADRDEAIAILKENGKL